MAGKRVKNYITMVNPGLNDYLFKDCYNLAKPSLRQLWNVNKL